MASPVLRLVKEVPLTRTESQRLARLAYLSVTACGSFMPAVGQEHCLITLPDAGNRLKWLESYSHG